MLKPGVICLEPAPDLLDYLSPNGDGSAFSAIQLAPDRLKVRLETKASPNGASVWDALRQRVADYLVRQRLGNVTLERAAEPPVRDPRSGKFRHVWAEMK